MKVEHINPFILSTIETFKTMLDLTPQSERPELKIKPYPEYDVSGIIGISGSATGSIALSYPKPVALKVVSRFISEEIKILDSDVTDGIGELTNIIAGSAKKHLHGLNLSISLPTVILGKDHKMSNPKDAQNILIPFSIEFGKFSLEVSLKNS